MIEALNAYLRAATRGADHHDAVVAAAEGVARRPWDVVHKAGLLARCHRRVAESDLALNRGLLTVKPTSRTAIVRIDKGQPFPVIDDGGRRIRGAFDTPVDMARLVVTAAIRSSDNGRPTTGLDPACGTGAFIVAMVEAGIPEVYGTDLDRTALAVAQIAAPRARLVIEDALKHGPLVDVLCGNPPFVPPERQDKLLRAELRRRFPWLKGRFDLVIPFAASAAERVRPGGGLGLVLPAAAMVQPYGAVLRRRWVQRHRFTELSGPHPFPGAAVEVMIIAMCIGDGPAPLPAFGLPAEDLLRLTNVPLSPKLQPGDIELIEKIRQRSTTLGVLALVDTGVVAHSPGGSKERLLHDEPGPGRVPYADARGFFAGQHRWLEYLPAQMHRAKSPDMFERPKIVIQRLRGQSPVRAAIDRTGVYVGHTCTVVQSTDKRATLEQILEVVQSPVSDAVTRVERGSRLDLYPRDVAAFPFPLAWLAGSDAPLPVALGLTADDMNRLSEMAQR